MQPEGTDEPDSRFLDTLPATGRKNDSPTLFCFLLLSYSHNTWYKKRGQVTMAQVDDVLTDLRDRYFERILALDLLPPSGLEPQALRSTLLQIDTLCDKVPQNLNAVTFQAIVTPYYSRTPSCSLEDFR
jgi:hypothetical protein